MISQFKKRPGFRPAPRPPRPPRPPAIRQQLREREPRYSALVKTCSRCLAVDLDRSEFTAHAESVDGLHSYCNLCREDMRKRKAAGVPQQPEPWERIWRGTCGACNQPYAGTHSKVCRSCLSEAKYYMVALPKAWRVL